MTNNRKKVERLENVLYDAEIMDLYNKVLPSLDNGIETVKNNKPKHYYTILKLHIPVLDELVEIDIRKKLKERHKNRFTQYFLDDLLNDFPKQIKVEFFNNHWIIVDYKELFKEN